MSNLIQALVRRDGDRWVAECVDLPILERSETLDGAISALKEAVKRNIEGRDLSALGMEGEPRLIVALFFGPFGMSA